MKKLSYFFAIALFAFSSSAFAHTQLKASNPKDGAMLMESPKTLHLEFNGMMRLLKLDVVDQQGKKVATDFRPTPNEASEFYLKLPKLEPGTYKVNWTLLGADTHTIKGHIGFMVH